MLCRSLKDRLAGARVPAVLAPSGGFTKCCCAWGAIEANVNQYRTVITINYFTFKVAQVYSKNTGSRSLLDLGHSIVS